MVKCYFSDFLNIQVEQFSKRPMVCIFALEHTEHHISDIGYRKMRSQRIKRCALTFFCIFQVLFAGLVVDLNVPYADILEMPTLFSRNSRA